MIDSVHVFDILEMRDQKDKLPTNARVVSITDPEEKFRPYKLDSEKVCTVQFDDLDYKHIDKEVKLRLKILEECEVFDDEMANKIYAFIMRCVDGRERIPLYVHCHAGVSRSAAVARFAADMANIPHGKIKKYDKPQLPNKLVYDKLHEANKRAVMPGF